VAGCARRHRLAPCSFMRTPSGMGLGSDRGGLLLARSACGTWRGEGKRSSVVDDLVSRTRCSVLHAAPQIRDPQLRRTAMGPGSAAHRKSAAQHPGHAIHIDLRRAVSERQRGFSFRIHAAIMSIAGVTSSAGNRYPWRMETPCRRGRRRVACSNPRASSTPKAF
jgi:hypothetical protein